MAFNMHITKSCGCLNIWADAKRVEATMTAEISTMRLDIGDVQEAVKNHDSWMDDVLAKHIIVGELYFYYIFLETIIFWREFV